MQVQNKYFVLSSAILCTIQKNPTNQTNKQTKPANPKHTITEYLRLEGTSDDQLVQPLNSKQRQLQQGAKDHAQSSSEYFQGWRVHILCGKAALLLDHPHNEKVFFSV